MIAFIAPEYRVMLEHNGLAGFEQAWDFEVEWVETPNDNRGGLSGVGRILLRQPEGVEVVAFLKRQQNHTRKTWRHPWRGEATFSREFRMIRHLQQHDVPTLEPIFFGEDYQPRSARAVLVTAALDGYRPLDDLGLIAELKQQPLSKKRQLLDATAYTARKMHEAGVQHRSLYAKHLFVKELPTGYRVAVIDLEKSRLNFVPWLRQFYDLVTLNYRTQGWSRSSRLYFFKQYYAIQSLGLWQKALIRLIMRRSKNKSMQAANEEDI
ncbi:MAG TPA: lipopolysaccharide kinase InaA family protein [Methylophilaceae bacterium]|nr:lipopolysaccharide kinase InaA family protein [Methylophilaceae bacterium]